MGAGILRLIPFNSDDDFKRRVVSCQRQIKSYFSVECYDKMSKSLEREENNLLLDSHNVMFL